MSKKRCSSLTYLIEEKSANNFLEVFEFLRVSPGIVYIVLLCLFCGTVFILQLIFLLLLNISILYFFLLSLRIPLIILFTRLSRIHYLILVAIDLNLLLIGEHIINQTANKKDS